MSETTVMNSRRRAARSAALWATALLLVAACDGDGLRPTPPTDPAEAYWDLELNHHAVTLSLAEKYDTITLAATPRNYKGEPLSGLPAPEYRSSSPTTVSVLPDGRVTAVQATAGSAGDVLVYATLTVGNVRHWDSVLVRVVDDPDPPVLTTFSIQPIPPDSAKSAAVPPGFRPGGYDRHASDLNSLVRATDADGSPIPGLLVDFRTSDRATAVIPWGDGQLLPQLLGRRPGTVTLYASVTAFGVRKADTLSYRIGWPLINGITIQAVTEGVSVPSFDAPELTIGTGGLVLWANATQTEVDVTFADPANIASYDANSLIAPPDMAAICALLSGYGQDCTKGGDIVLRPGTVAFRTFLTPGVYEYRNAGGARGRIVVVDER